MVARQICRSSLVTRDPKTDNGYMETCAFGRAGPPDTPVDQELRYASKSGLPLPLQLAQMIEFSLATENTENKGQRTDADWLVLGVNGEWPAEGI